jgi:aryl-alcohol dehydrogenase-like predicted oxidoreductase
MPNLGRSDLDIFPLALGGNVFGWTADAEESHAVLDSFVELGGNFIDTADAYSAWVPGNSGGESETIIGQWVTARGNRDRVIIGTKVSQHPDFTGLSATNIVEASDASLTRLGTDYIDLYWAHFDDVSVPLEETASAFNDLVVAGKVKYIGVSNYSAERVQEWVDVATANGLALPIALQPHYNLVHRTDFESKLLPVAEKNGLAVVPYFALASGFLSGKYRTKADLEGAQRAGGAGGYLTEAGLGVIDALEAIANEHKTEIATVALAWLLHRPTVAAPIASARTVEQLPALMASATLKLTADETASLDMASAAIAD